MKVALPGQSEVDVAPTGVFAPDASSQAIPLGPGTKLRYFGDYELLEEIARGGMGVVYKAQQVRLKRVVALKMILAGQFATSQDVARFHAEAQAAAKLDHPGIVPVFEVGEHQHQHYFSMAFVDGDSLARKISAGPLPPREAAELMERVAEAVAYAHVEGVIHRDLKPGNILIDKNGTPRITDFGLAKRVEGEAAGLTTTGQVLGTPSYMPPEQARGDAAATGPLADIYALGAVLYCMLTGRPPFQAASAVETLIQVIAKEPASPRIINPSVPRDLETIGLKCLEKEPSRRYSSAQELAAELQRYLDGRPIHARPISSTAQAWRWCQRNAALSMTMLVATLLLLTVTGLYFSSLIAKNAQLAKAFSAEQAAKQLALQNAQATEIQKLLAENNATKANAAAEQASKSATQADEEKLRALRHLYVAHMNQAQSAWESGDIPRFRTLLDEQELRSKQQLFDPLTLAKLNWQPGQQWTAAETARMKELLVAKRLRSPPEFDPRGWEWHYWKRAANSYLRKMESPAEPSFRIDRFTITSDRQHLVGVCDHKPRAYTWEIKTGKLLATQAFPPTNGTMTILSPNGSRVAIVHRPNFQYSPELSFDATVYNVADGQLIHTFPKLGLVRRAELDAQGEHLVTASHVAGDGGALRVHVWKIGSTDSPVDLAGEIPVTEIIKGEKFEGSYPHKGYIHLLAISPKGTHIVTSGHGDLVLRLWDAQTGKLLYTLQGHQNAPLSVCFLDGGRQVATSAVDRMIKVWNVETGECVHSLAGNSEENVTQLTSNGDSQLFASVGWGKTIRVWSAALGDMRAVIRGHEGSIRSLLFSGSDEIAALDDNGIRIWKVSADQTAQAFQFPGIAGWKLGLVFDSSGDQLSLVGPTINSWDLASGKLLRKHDPTAGRKGRTVAMSPTGEHYAWTDQTTVEIYHSQDDRRLFAVPTGHTDYFDAVAISADARYLATGSQDKTIKLWRLHAENGQAELLATHEGFSGAKQQMLFTPDSSLLIASGQSPELRVWHVETGKSHPMAGSFGFKVSHVAMSSNGKLLAAASENQGHTRLWNLENGELLDMLPTGTAKSIAFHPDGTRLASAHGELGIKLWDIATGQEVLALEQQFPGINTTMPTAIHNYNQVVFSPNGQKLVAANYYGLVKVWDATPSEK
jgi:eukaryotic-like serine/threonine-protein kinase